MRIDGIVWLRLPIFSLLCTLILTPGQLTAQASGSAWVPARWITIGPEAKAASDDIVWSGGFKPGNISLTATNSKLKYQDTLTVGFTDPPSDNIKPGTKVPIKIHAVLTISRPAGWKKPILKDSAGVSMTVYDELRITTTKELHLEYDQKTDDWSGELEFPWLPSKQDKGSFVISIIWFALDNSASWQGGWRWEYGWLRAADDTKAPPPVVEPAGDTSQLPIVFIPGVAGSILEVEQIADAGNQLWPLAPVRSRKWLSLKPGESDAKIVVNGVIKAVLTTDVYGSFLDGMNAAGYDGIKDKKRKLVTCPYDWRLTNTSNVYRVEQAVNDLLRETGSKKVVLITHSMGGLLARAYLKSVLDARSKVAMMITAAGPHLGAPKAYWGTLVGYNFGNDSANPNLMKLLMPYWPSAYQLMPWRPFIHWLEGGAEWSLAQSYGLAYRSITMTDFNWFKEDEYVISKDWPWHLPTELVNQADAFRSLLVPGGSTGVPTFNIIGYGHPTLWGYTALKWEGAEKWLGGVVTTDGINAELQPDRGQGDETVPIWSTEGLADATRFYIESTPEDPASHGVIMGSKRVQRLIQGILKGTITRPEQVTEFNAMPNPKAALPEAQMDWFMELSVRCPVDLHVYDKAGRHNGLNERKSEEFRIPRSSFLYSQETQTAVIYEARDAYRVKIVGRSEGTFSLKVVMKANGKRGVITYNDVPVKKGTVAEVIMPGLLPIMANPPEMTVVTDGTKSTVKPNITSGTTQANPPVTPPDNPPVSPGEPQPLEPEGSSVTTPASLGGIHTFAYHQVTSRSDALAVGNGIVPMLSRNGQRVVMAYAPSKDDSEKKQRVAVANADGSNFQFVDAYQPLFYVNLLVAISPDGRQVASTDGGQIRLASADGSGARTIFRVMNNIGSLRLSSDGSTVFFILHSDAVIPDTKERLERGVYAVRADGSGLRAIASATAIARAVGLQPSEIGSLYSSSRGWALDVSDDDRRLTFLVLGKGTPRLQYAMTVSADGSGLRTVLTATQYMMAVGISGNGQKVGAIATNLGAEGYQGWVVNYDGTGARKLTDKAANSGIVSLNRDGSRVVFGQEAVLYDTSGSGRLMLGTPASPSMACRLGSRLLPYLMMDSSGRQFSWVMEDDKGQYQMARLDVDPRDIGRSPRLSDVKITPERLIADDRTLSMISARVRADNPVIACIGVTSFRDGLVDQYIGSTAYLYDNGKGGDTAANDGVYASDNLKAAKLALLGPHVLRLFAEVKTSDGVHDATGYETGPVTVVVP
ncbi:MAG: lipase/acyltransferase domain-containing protein [Armatimonadota bacterium]